MKILNLVQGSTEWLAARCKYHTASEAPVMMGASPNLSRADLLRVKYNGDEKEISRFVQERVFDKGHEVEALCRPGIEQQLGEDLFPCMVTDDESWLAASLDGLTMNRKIIWEHKQFSQGKVDFMKEYSRVPPADEWQVQQQLMLTGAERCVYTVGNDPDKCEQLIVLPDPEAFEALRKGWAQFDNDLENYEPANVEAEAVGHTMDSLPALRIELTGMVKASNLVAYKDHALAVFNSINTELQTDQDFADAESTVKWCKDVEDRLEAAKQHALSQTEDIETLFSALDDLKASARQKRLELDKLVKARKLAVRDEIRRNADEALAQHLRDLFDRLDGRVRVPAPEANFAAAMKNKRAIASLRDSVDQVLADAKIASSAQADDILANLKAFDETAADYLTLFPDLERLSYKAPEDFIAAVKLRIAEHKEAEEIRKAEAERVAEEAAKKAEQPTEATPSKPEPAKSKQAWPAAADTSTPPLDLEPAAPDVATRHWQITATFELEASEQYGAKEIAGRLKASLSNFESLRDVSAEEITGVPHTTEKHAQLL